MHQKHTIYPLGSKYKLPRSARSREQMRLLGHATLKQGCEIQCEAQLSKEHKWLSDESTDKHCVQRDSQKAFQFTGLHHLPWIYCSNTNCTMGLCQKWGYLYQILYY